jgi:hypothetical protein
MVHTRADDQTQKKRKTVESNKDGEDEAGNEHRNEQHGHGSKKTDTSIDSDWKLKPPYALPEGVKEFKAVHEGKCHCGLVKFQISREKPLSAKYCHCTTCQQLHGMPHPVQSFPK